MDWKWREGVKNGVYSYSEMNVMDGIGRMMELWREKNDHSSILPFLCSYCQYDEEVKDGNGIERTVVKNCS